jgi:hypothetical protein
MATRRDPYPNLARYLKSWRASYEFRSIGRQWPLWIGIPCATLAFETSWVASLAIIVAAISLQSVLRRSRGISGKDLFKESLAFVTNKRLQRAVNTGTLDDLVGPEVAALLESCAALAQRSFAARVRVALNGPKLPRHYREVLRDSSRVVEAEMAETTQGLQIPLATHVALTESAIEDLRRHESNLRMLAQESDHLAKAMEIPKGGDEIRQAIARMRAIREVEDSLPQSLEQE